MEHSIDRQRSCGGRDFVRPSADRASISTPSAANHDGAGRHDFSVSFHIESLHQTAESEVVIPRSMPGNSGATLFRSCRHARQIRIKTPHKLTICASKKSEFRASHLCLEVASRQPSPWANENLAALLNLDGKKWYNTRLPACRFSPTDNVLPCRKRDIAAACRQELTRRV